MDQQRPGVRMKRHQCAGTFLELNARPMDFGNECHHETPLASRSSVVICPGSHPGNHSSAASIKGPEHPSSHLYPNSPPLRRSHRLCSQMPFWREARGRKGGNPEDGEFIPKRLGHLKRGQTGRQL